MKSFAASFGIALCGLVTSVLVAIANVALARMTGIDFFTFTVWFIVPVGAICVGFAAASGYYFGSLYFHKRPTAILFVQIAAIAALTQLLIYYLGYATMVFDDGRRVADIAPFSKYLDVLLTSSHYRIGRAQSDTGAVGDLGYWLAFFQFLGFLFGGIAVFFFLKTKMFCQACDRYLRPLAQRVKTFSSAEAAVPYYDHVFSLPVDGPEFAELVRAKAEVEKPLPGALHIVTTLMSCPKCKAQTVDEKVQNFNGSEWKEYNPLSRRIAIPGDVDLAPVFRS
jgi:hypothetical protein